MAQWVLKATGRVVPRQSLRPLTTAEKHSTVDHKKHDVFDALIERRMGTSINPPPTTEDQDPTMEELTNQNDLDDKMDEMVESPTMRTYLTLWEEFLSSSQHLIRSSMQK